MKTEEYYKLLLDGKACHGGNYDYNDYIKNKKYLPQIKEIEVCSKGYHLTNNPFKWLESANQIFLVTLKKDNTTKTQIQDDKICVSTFKFNKEIKWKNHKEFLKFRSQFYNDKKELKKLEEKLGDIPTKQDVLNLQKRIYAIEWYKRQTPNMKNIIKKVKEIYKAFHIDKNVEVELHELKDKSDWDSARASAWASTWDSARASALDSAWASALDSAWASARASALDSAWDSARASAWEVVKDLMKAKGYNENPFLKILELWEEGLYPVGILKDGKFHVYYVPKSRGK